MFIFHPLWLAQLFYEWRYPLFPLPSSDKGSGDERGSLGKGRARVRGGGVMFSEEDGNSGLSLPMMSDKKPRTLSQWTRLIPLNSWNFLLLPGRVQNNNLSSLPIYCWNLSWRCIKR
jgi:hypothetical protein